MHRVRELLAHEEGHTTRRSKYSPRWPEQGQAALDWPQRGASKCLEHKEAGLEVEGAHTKAQGCPGKAVHTQAQLLAQLSAPSNSSSPTRAPTLPFKPQ